MSRSVIHDAVHADGTPTVRHDPELREQAVRMVLEQGMSAAGAARELQLGASIVRYWVRAARDKTT
ncbi:transposase [Streptacidiphilus griseoplanus]|uniref:transposase n=1 Tax=Peterkaempfera griseoplana TaxID=66896 RepID=UPI0006E13FAB|nr:transposase [Peterkaempfera griseoplana]